MNVYVGGIVLFLLQLRTSPISLPTLTVELIFLRCSVRFLLVYFLLHTISVLSRHVVPNGVECLLKIHKTVIDKLAFSFGNHRSMEGPQD